MKIQIKVNDGIVSARTIDGPTARDFITLLPLTLTMNDLFKREKFGSLPRAISNDGKHTHSYALGDIAYWPPGPDVAVFYRHDGEAIPEPGIIVLGKVTSGLEALKVRGPVTVRFEIVDKQAAESERSASLAISGAQS
jgi:hypothetical protein